MVAIVLYRFVISENQEEIDLNHKQLAERVNSYSGLSNFAPVDPVALHQGLGLFSKLIGKKLCMGDIITKEGQENKKWH